MSDHITYRSVASKAIEILHLASNDEEVYFMNRTEDAIRDIDCIQTYINDVCCFDVDSNGRICLPKGFVRPIAIFYTPPPPPLSEININNPPRALYGGAGAGYLYYADIPFLNRCGCGTNGWAGSSRTYQVQGNTLVVGCQGGKIEMCYLAYKTNDSGELSISSEMMQAAAYFLCEEYATAKFYPENTINRYHRNYVAKVNYIRSHQQLIKMMEMQPQLRIMLNSWCTIGNNAIT